MGNLKIFTDNIEQKAAEQIQLLMMQEAFKSCKVRIMPDVHAGAGCVIGFTANLGNKVIPNIVGVDIGCGMFTVKIGDSPISLEKLDSVIRECVPSGMTVHEAALNPFPLMQNLHCYSRLKNVDWLERSLGTLGGGNHFIEVDVDEKGCQYLIIHTGSRNLGKQVADIYQTMAVEEFQSVKADVKSLIATLKEQGRQAEIQASIKELKDKSVSISISKELCYLEGEQREQYLHDMKICQRFARNNREEIGRAIFSRMGWDTLSPNFHTVHNYIDDSNMVRKGAISAQRNEVLLIPINMRDGCIYGVGLGNDDWNCSAPHGAGRLMSRMEAKRKITMEDYRESMQNIYTTSVSEGTLDEAPQAYKPMEEIVSRISQTVEITKILKPVYNFKASD